MAESLDQALALRELLILLQREPRDKTPQAEPALLFATPDSPCDLADALKGIYTTALVRAEPVATSKLWAEDRGALMERLLQVQKIAPPDTDGSDERIPGISMETLRGQLLDATQTLLRAWNSAHDPMQKLPAELWLVCLPEMSQEERCDLLRVSSFWHARLSRELPELWQKLDIFQCTDHCAELLRRSATSPLSITAGVRGPEEVRTLDSALRTHAGRLPALHLGVSLEDPHAEYDMSLAVRTAFRYTAPELASLSITATQWAAFKLSKFFLLGDAPSLRTVHLAGVPLRADCPALWNATNVRLEGKVGNIEALFDVFPNMTELEVRKSHHRSELPPIPDESPLTSMSVSGRRFQMIDDSYLDLERLHIDFPGAESYVSRVVNLAAQQGLKSALTVASDLSVEHRTAGTWTISTGAFRESYPVKQLLSNLAVRELILTDVAALRLYEEFSLPRLEHLTIRFTEPPARTGWQPGFAIYAPQLQTVEFSGEWPVASAASRIAFLRDSLGVDEGHGEMLVRVNPERARVIPRRARDMYSYYASCTAASFSCDDGSWL